MFFTPIGIARSPLTTPGAPPIQGVFSPAEGTIEIFPEYQGGLESIGGFSHLIIIYQFDRADKCALVEQPLTDGDVPHGIFATRHFNRPNPIGISYVELLRVEEGMLRVRGIDLLDETPILDIKPYIPAFDCIPHAVSGWVTSRHIDRIREMSLRAQKGVRSVPQHH